MKILDILSPTYVFPNIECNSKKAAMELLAKNIASSNNGIDQIDMSRVLVLKNHPQHHQ